MRAAAVHFRLDGFERSQSLDALALFPLRA